MKANELMIGDILSVVPSGTLIRVAAIHGKKIGYHERNDKLSWVRIGLVQPIPLASEILEKNGFVKAPMVSDTPPYDKDEDGNMHFSLKSDFWGWWQQNQTFLIPANGLGWLEFKYVHELQHALRLCDISKEIKL